jgi:hypothetical protein
MSGSEWDEIHGFKMLSEFERFVEWIDDRQKCGIVVEIPARDYYSGVSTFKQKWFRHVESGEVWRLVWPDDPFHGVFERVKLPESPINALK